MTDNRVVASLTSDICPPVAQFGKGGLAVGFLMGEADACPLVGGAESYPSGGRGLVSGWD